MLELPTKTRDAIGLKLVADEIARARSMHAPMKSAHEAYAVILEEVDEFWDEVKKRRSHRDKNSMRKELVQIGAMAIRALSDLQLADSSEAK
jgi:hypothetical protein